MIISDEHLNVLDKADELVEYITQSDIVQKYNEAKHAMETDEDAQTYIKDFESMKDQYEDVQRFGMYHPDYYEIMRTVRSAKRKMDMHEKVAAFKIAERQLQQFLDEISEIIARSTSEHIMVPKDGAALTDGGCSSGSCGTGGSCGCQAS